MRQSRWVFGLGLLVGLIACSGGEEADDDAVAALSTAETEATLPGVDCRAACPGAVDGESMGLGISGGRVAAVRYVQKTDCSLASDAPAPGRKQAGDPCRFRDVTGQWEFATRCPEFDCGETGSFRASACVGARLENARDFARRELRCADRETACAAALQAASGRLCR
jgi:hypothetical protein